VGATAAVEGCAGLPDVPSLVQAIWDYEDHLAEHIEDTRKDLADCPAEWHGRLDMLTRRLAALETLALSFHAGWALGGAPE